MPFGLQSHIHPAHLHIAQIYHCPTELVRSRHGYNLVGDLVIVSICLKLQPGRITSTEFVGISYTYIILCGIFRIQVNVSYEGIVKVIQRRHAEYLFVKSTQIQIFVLERLPRCHDGRRIFVFITRCGVGNLRSLVYKCPQQTGL